MRDALAATDMETFYGKIKFDATGKNIAKPMVLRQIQDGQYKVVAPTKWASAKLASTRARQATERQGAPRRGAVADSAPPCPVSGAGDGGGVALDRRAACSITCHCSRRPRS